MKTLLIPFFTLLAFFTHPAHAATCETTLLHPIINVDGYILNLTEVLKKELLKKGYVLTSNAASEYDVALHATQEEGGIFKKAVVQIGIRNNTTEQITKLPPASKTCLTELCSVYDFNSAALKEIKILQKQLPACASH